ncbi:unnamed protein product [Ilex paraguariensis]|uniref:Uncharacterized protein n=1 Tax=Ilex paraguariensis TaxID=185542 RepID=A0ABC8RQ33_9AQUA
MKEMCMSSSRGLERQHKDKKEEVAGPEADPERDQRTVFAYQFITGASVTICCCPQIWQISLKADERDVYEFFSRAGKVNPCSSDCPES